MKIATIDPLLCCYARGQCDCHSAQKQNQNNPLVVICRSCVTICPQKALRYGEKQIIVDERLCNACGQCAEICCSGAIHII